MPSLLGRFPALLEALPAGSILHIDKELLVELGIQWFNTILLTFILAKVLYNPVKKMLDSRASRIAAQLSEASGAQLAAASLKEEYEGKLAGIEAERVSIMESARGKARGSAEKILAEARESAEQIRARAAADISLAEEKAKADVKREILDIATLLAGRFVAVSLDSQTQEKLVDSALDELGGVKWLA
jgi:F-type H+-transporting ATPase subunit b